MSVRAGREFLAIPGPTTVPDELAGPLPPEPVPAPKGRVPSRSGALGSESQAAARSSIAISA